MLDNSHPPTSNYKGRFAPSPTGELHWGSLFNALASFLQARSQQGEWLLRIDDLDPSRCQQQFTDAILFALDRFGLHWDGAIHYQSQHTEDYQDALSALNSSDRLYACTCSRKQLKRYHNRHPEAPDYPGFCRNKAIDTSKQHAIRIKTHHHPILINDPLQGEHQQILSKTCGDFIVLRSDKLTAYHLASVTDDYTMGITQAVRGYDLLQSSIQQHYLQQLLHYPAPQYIHLPLIVDATNTKLSKQTGATAITNKHLVETVFILLQQLKQSPPAELRNQPLETVLAWAIENWTIDYLKGCFKIIVA